MAAMKKTRESSLAEPSSNRRQITRRGGALAAAAAATHHHLPRSRQPPEHPRRKRGLSAIENDGDVAYNNSKRAKITVEIKSEPRQQHARPTSRETVAVPKRVPTAEEANSMPPPPPPPSLPIATPPRPSTAKSSTSLGNSTSRIKDAKVVKPYKKKVVDGIKHELARLQPSLQDIAEASTSTRRKLRSQEATRYKSELSAYFPEYDEVIGNDPVEEHSLNLETPIVVVNEDTLTPEQDADVRQLVAESKCIRKYSDKLFTELTDSQTIDYDFLKPQHIAAKPDEDPLSDSMYQYWHSKAERLERSIRNSEKGRAQHERDQIVRIHESLQGPDWLRVMGVNGITDSKKRDFEPARDHFIKGCASILDKFRNWASEEKRRKLEKDRAKLGSEITSRASAQVDDEDDEEEEHDRDDEESDMAAATSIVVNKGKRTSRRGSESPPPSDDSAGKQLRDESLLAQSRRIDHDDRTRRGKPVQARAAKVTSTVHKKYQRVGTSSAKRCQGESALAFGHRVPDLEKREFELPTDVRDDEAVVQSPERQKRLTRRTAKAKAAMESR